jgi:hypothetical protein
MIIVLMMEAVSTCEMSAIFYETTLHSIPEDGHIRTLLLLFAING